MTKYSKGLDFGYRMVFSYPAPSNLSYGWNFGIFAILSLVVQIITGILLAMHYIPQIDYAFLSVEHIMRNVYNGWLLRFVHQTGASVFFIAIYIHMFRGLYYGSFMPPRQYVWIIGSIIFVLMIITAFFGKTIAKDGCLLIN